MHIQGGGMKAESLVGTAAAILAVSIPELNPDDEGLLGGIRLAPFDFMQKRRPSFSFGGAGLHVAVVMGAMTVAVPADGTVLADVPMPTMAVQAETIVRGVVQQVGARIVVLRSGHRVETRTRISVQSCWKGDCGTAVTVVEPGGETPYGRAVTHGAPRYAVGEEVVVFLERGRGGELHTYGMALGRFQVHRDAEGGAWAIRDLSDVVLARDVGSRMTLAEGSALEVLPLSDLSEMVRRAWPPQSRPEGIPR
ncbi:MAG: hypothetical protein ACFB9M_04615 [Myxococcota bacterium]